MKKIFFTISIILFFLLVFLTVILSTVGFETNKFNNFISDKILEKNQNILLKLEKIKFKFDLKDFNLFLETKNPELNYKNLNIPIKNVRVYLDFTSLIKSKPKIDKIDISSKEFSIAQLKKIIIKTKPSSLNSLITNKVKNGKLVINLELYFNDNMQIDNFIARGKVKKMDGIITNNLILKEVNFDLFACDA